MDQVLLAWGGETSVLLSRITDADGCWLCLREINRKISKGMREHAKGGKHAS